MNLFVLHQEQHRARAIRHITSLNLDVPEPWAVWVAPYEKLRTKAQNARMWRLYALIAEGTGYTKDDIHDLLRKKFLGPVTKRVMGEEIVTLPSTTELSVAQMSEYMDAIERFAAEAGVML